MAIVGKGQEGSVKIWEREQKSPVLKWHFWWNKKAFFITYKMISGNVWKKQTQALTIVFQK